MKMSSPTLIIYTVMLLVIHAAMMMCCSGSEVNATSGCVPKERNALLKLKASFSDPSSRLSSWNTSTDCCTWAGVECDGLTGQHVVALYLQNERYDYFDDWVPPFQLTSLQMRSCEIVGGEFPKWLQTQKELEYLYMSNCSISGTIPYWFHYINMSYLNLSNNHIEGPLPDSFCQMKYLSLLDLSNNRLSGNLPAKCWPDSLEYLYLSNNSLTGEVPYTLRNCTQLGVLDLSINGLSGPLPEFLTNFSSLSVLILSSNKLSGVIPKSIGGAYSLRWLQLNNNNFTGEVPSSLRNCTALILLDVGENSISGKLPKWIGNDLLNLEVLRLRSNQFYGRIPLELCQLSQLQLLDLASNKLREDIPGCFGNFSGMVHYFNSADGSFGTTWGSLTEVIKGVAQEYLEILRYVVSMDLSDNDLMGEIPMELTKLTALLFLNLSHNQLQGHIPGRIGDMKMLESLDMSNNNLFGSIPVSFLDLKFLSRLNLSQNNLTGEIPTGGQLESLVDPSIYQGNPGLCGHPLPTKCHDDKVSNNSTIYQGNPGLCGPPLLKKCHGDKVSNNSKGTRILIWIIMAVIISALLFLAAMALILARRSKRRKRFDEMNELLTLEGYTEAYDHEKGRAKRHDLRMFSYASIAASTNDFSKDYKLGEGGFGPVYKGQTAEGHEIAVKLLSRSSGQGLLEFKTELILISKLQHVNLVKLVGFCVHREDKMIVYDYMPNKSLDFFLFDQSKRVLLDWVQRFNIIQGIAQGLLYLHKYSRLSIVHRDLKCSNILLDENLNPKISDFGLARIFKQNSDEANTNRRVGTFGYMAPEYAMQGMFSFKSDVYSFGVLVLELVSGRKNTSFQDIDGPLNLVEYAWDLWYKDSSQELMDPTLSRTCNVEQLKRCINVGLLCVEHRAADRPDIEDVVSMFKHETIPLPPPRNPAFITRNNVIEELGKSTLDNLSVNELSISQTGGR